MGTDTLADALARKRARAVAAGGRCGITPRAAVMGLGFALGVRHAFDADHMAAVSTLVARSPGLGASSLAGAAWGLGHTSALLVVALLVVILGIHLPPYLAPLLELLVAAMLVGLGMDLLRRQSRPAPASRTRRPFLVGVVHGLAGSASLMLAVLTTIPQQWLALGYVAAFGLGSVGGMAAMSAVLAVPAGRLPRALGTSAAVWSIAVGALLAWEVGHASGWFA
jgi:high-affinity nickel-transport protein